MWHTPTRPGRSGVAGQNRTGLGDLSVEGSGATGSGVQETLQKPRHHLQAQNRAKAIATLAAAHPMPPPLPLCGHATRQGSRAMISRPAGQPTWLRITCFNRLGLRLSAERDEGSGQASFPHQRPGAASPQSCVCEITEKTDQAPPDSTFDDLIMSTCQEILIEIRGKSRPAGKTQGQVGSSMHQRPAS